MTQVSINGHVLANEDLHALREALGASIVRAFDECRRNEAQVQRASHILQLLKPPAEPEHHAEIPEAIPPAFDPELFLQTVAADVESVDPSPAPATTFTPPPSGDYRTLAEGEKRPAMVIRGIPDPQV
jgi:hypothetical protein